MRTQNDQNWCDESLGINVDLMLVNNFDWELVGDT